MLFKRFYNSKRYDFIYGGIVVVALCTLVIAGEYGYDRLYLPACFTFLALMLLGYFCELICWMNRKPKVGGWPRWVQNPQWPPAEDGEHVEMVCQLDWMTFPDAPWCLGGYGYVFVKISDKQLVGGELALQTT